MVYSMCFVCILVPEAESKENMVYGTLCQSRLQHIYHGMPYARVDFIPQSGTLDLASEHVYSSHATLPFSPPPTKEGNILPQATIAHMLYSYI